jgi:hypothetical protein
MNENTSPPPPGDFTPPVSSFTGPIAELVGHGMLTPPSRPGLLATLDEFEIVRILGAGGMGIVLLARDAKTGAQAALKMVRPELVSDPQVVHRFLKEAGHQQRLKHRNVVEVLTVRDRERGPYFAMPFFEHGSLAKKIRPGEPLEAGLALDFAIQIAEALQYAHRRGIIHRDLKPANILLTGDRKACLGDFGLARTLFNDTIIDLDNQQCEGTAPYMSPGVAAGNVEDTRCDIYGFGALLYEMLTGEPPYKGRTTKEIREQIIAHAPPAILDLNPKADPGLVAIAETAMARELRDRYADISDVLADLNRVREGKAPAGAGGALRDSLKKARATSAPVWVPALVLLLALVGWALWRGQSAKQRATSPSVTATNLAAAKPGPPDAGGTNRVAATQPVTPQSAGSNISGVAIPAAVARTNAVPRAAVDFVRAALQPYGTWLDVAPYGLCWRPTAAVTDRNWRPYAEQGRWIYTQYGWHWHSDYSWGQIAFHYGRWTQSNGAWVWVPGYDWAPAWVCWREAEGFLGWAPLPPDAAFSAGVGLVWNGKAAADSGFGLGPAAFTFVACEHFRDRGFRGVMAPRDQVETLFKDSAIKNGYRLENSRLAVEGPGREHVAAVTRREVKIESAVIRELPGQDGH